jgi:hypothetical protein
MFSTRARRRWLTVGTLLVSMLGVCVLSAGAAAAATVWTPVSPPPTGAQEAPPTTMVLASTGLDIMVPVVLGLGLLLLGTVAVGWAFLATGRRGQHR